MNTVSISGSLRGNVGKKDAKILRREGKVPGVIYGGKEQLHIVVDEYLLLKIVDTPQVNILKIGVGDKEYNTIVKHIQTHPVTDNILHVDFLELIPTKPVTVTIPLIFNGTPTGVLKGGVLYKKMRKINVRSLPEFLPDNVTTDIKDLDIGDSIRIQDIKIDNCKILEIPTALVLSVKTARTVVDIPVEGAAATTEAAAEAPAKEGAEKAKGK